MKNVFLFCFILYVLALPAQKNDYVWLTGYGSGGGCLISPDGCFGINRINFNSGTAQVSYDSLPVDFRATNTSYSDDNGNLLFYTNGMFIYNSLGEIVEGSDTLNPGYGHQYWGYRGYSNRQGIIALPIYGEPNNYYLLHTSADTANGSWYPGADAIRITKLDMNANGGRGKVVYKNQIVLDGGVGENLSALRHGNGRDWWVFNPRNINTCPNRILVDATGAHLVNNPPCNGQYVLTGILTETCFSPNGDWYIYNDEESGTHVYRVNRCSGELVLHESFQTSYPADTMLYRGGVAVSPNNRYLYVGNCPYIVQFDLQAPIIALSADTVAVFDGYKDPYNSFFSAMALGPDGKIYVCSPHSETNFTVIENPDLPGNQCNVNQHSLQLPSFSVGMPNFPNYRLANWQFSACDTVVTGLNEVLKGKLSVFPSPATSNVTIEYEGLNWNKGEVKLQVVNNLSQPIYSVLLPHYSAYIHVDVSTFSNGVYMVQILQNNTKLYTSKLVKQ